ncbi:MAG: prepilin-type N-terminal cleavage/methylation domain-containing protein [Nitrospinales bacterium]
MADARGLTLLEVLITITILSIGFLGTASLVTTFVQKNAQVKRITAATTLIQDKIEAFKSATFSSITNGSETNIDSRGQAGGPYSRSWVVTTSGLVKTITVTVTWSIGASNKSRSMTTAISQ